MTRGVGNICSLFAGLPALALRQAHAWNRTLQKLRAALLQPWYYLNNFNLDLIRLRWGSLAFIIFFQEKAEA